MVQNNIFSRFYKKLALLKRVKIIRFIDLFKLGFALLKYCLTGRNSRLEMVINIDGIYYYLLDIESLFIVSPHYEEFIWRYVLPKGGDVFLDIGAHVGKYTLKVAKMVGMQGKVIAIEPDPENFRALLLGINLNKLSNVSSLPIAAWNKECELNLYFTDPSSNKVFLGKGSSSVKRIRSNSCKVTGKPLDKILDLQKLNWVKIDVEGAELEVIEGAERTISKHKPVIIMEVTTDKEVIFNFMKNLGYTPHSITPYLILFTPDKN